MFFQVGNFSFLTETRIASLHVRFHVKQVNFRSVSNQPYKPKHTFKLPVNGKIGLQIIYKLIHDYSLPIGISPPRLPPKVPILGLIFFLASKKKYHDKGNDCCLSCFQVSLI